MNYIYTKRGGVPGGHYVIDDGRRTPFISPTREFSSIPLRYSDVVVDIGAYVGTYAIRCARFPVRRVVAYEPTPETAEILALTSLPNLELRRVAVVGDPTVDRVDLHIAPGLGIGNSLVRLKGKLGVVSVPAISYDDAVRDATIVKIDVEGAEYDYGPIVRPKLRAAIVDFHPVTKIGWIDRANRIVEELLDSGFKPVIAPEWSNGWTRAGSWIRDLEHDRTVPGFEPMLDGDLCCGCGRAILGHRRSLCLDCFPTWSRKHRVGYEPAEFA